MGSVADTGLVAGMGLDAGSLEAGPRMARS